MDQYIVTGMSCAACQARVEKAVGKVPGVSSVSVSLLTNSMGVEGTAPQEEVIRAVEAAGYGASLKGAPAMLCPMVMYISAARKPADSRSLRFSFGVSRSFSASSCAA